MDDLLSFACLLSFSHRCCGALRGTNRQLLVALAERTTELRVAPQCPGVKEEAWHQLVVLLKALPNLRHLDLRGVGISAEGLSELRRALPRCKSWDLRFCWRLPWQYLESWLCEARGAESRQISHSLTVTPSPDLTPLQVVLVQAYALHRPYERFSRLFDPPSRYSMMLGCDRFQVEEEKGPEHHFRRSFVVTFWNSSSSSSEDGEHLLGSQMEEGAPWCTDSVVPIDMASQTSN
ncbi:unnamed protein product, partial [Cladocopium goreaui]